jgi:hypothetical protein
MGHYSGMDIWGGVLESTTSGVVYDSRILYPGAHRGIGRHSIDEASRHSGRGIDIPEGDLESVTVAHD